MTMDELREKCLECRACVLCESRTNVVFGVGDCHSPVMLVGEAPGRNEDLQGEPFVGRAGTLLDSYLTAVGLARESVYIANILKCRPPDNRDPKPEEQDACIGYLREQFRIMRPKIVVCLGRIAAQRLIAPSFLVTKEHGRFIDKNGTLFMGTFHPAALLRNPANKGPALEDFTALAEKIKSLG